MSKITVSFRKVSWDKILILYELPHNIPYQRTQTNEEIKLLVSPKKISTRLASNWTKSPEFKFNEALLNEPYSANYFLLFQKPFSIFVMF